MGSSHYAALPTWRALVAAGIAAWAVDTADLLESPGLLTADTLVLATSQSGASGEMVELLDRAESGEARVGAVLGVAADEDSPLARRADAFVPLRSGTEATVSTKSYLNSLVVHHRLVRAFLGDDTALDLASVVDDVARVLASLETIGVGDQALANTSPRVVAVGKGDSSTTALYAGLITKESAKVPMEGYVGGEFRHGPYELAGPGLTAFLYDAGAPEGDRTLPALTRDLVASGSTVYSVGGPGLPGVHRIHVPTSSPLGTLACGAVVAQQVAVSLARANDVVPGDFLYGSKVTRSL